MTKEKTTAIYGAHRGMGCTDHDVYQTVRDIKNLPVENTLDSIAAAFDHGADYVEIDAVMSADGKIFLMHNVAPEDHFFGEKPPGLLNLTAFADFKNLKTGRFQNGAVASMAEALELIASRDTRKLPWAVNIELKGVQKTNQVYEENDFIEHVVEVVKKSSLPLERVLWSSFALEHVLRTSRLLPQSSFAMLFCEDGESNKTYANHIDVPRYSFLEFNADNVDTVQNIWLKETGAPAKNLYMHPEIASVNEEMLEKMAVDGFKVNPWPFKEVLTEERQKHYRWLVASAAAKGIPLTIITDYLPEMKKLGL